MADIRDRDLAAVKATVTDYLDGMIYGQAERLRDAFDPRGIQVGRFNGALEFLTAGEFVASLAPEAMLPAGTPYESEIQFVDMTGDVAVVKLTDSCFGTRFTDYLTLLRHEDRWRIVAKVFFDHAGDASR